MSTIKELLDLGFTPAASLAILACGFIWVRMELKDRKQQNTREQWHASTLKRVEVVEKHAEECNKDRSELKIQVGVLTERTDRFTRCPKSDCPNRLP